MTAISALTNLPASFSPGSSRLLQVLIGEQLAVAEDREDALRRVWDAVATSGTDDHIVFLEHPDLPEHWRRFSGRPED